MSNLFKKDISIFVLLSILSVLWFSCEYETPVRDAEYPEQVIYMPAAANNNGVFVINDITRKIGELPLEGSPYRYVVNLADKKFVIPLSVYRGGVNNKGGFNVDIAVDTDTISKLIANGNLADTILVLPQDKYSIDNSIYLSDGDEIGQFNLEIDLDFLLDNYPHNVYALGVNISSTERETNPKLSTTIIIIDTKIMKSTPDFSFSVDKDDPSLVTFENKSLMAVSYKWDFGDGTTSMEESPGTHRYPTSVFDEFYTITLTTTGIDGHENVLTKSSEEAAPPTWTEGVIIAKGLISPNFTITKWQAGIFQENMETGTSAVKVNYTNNSGYVIFKFNQMDISGFHELAIRVRGGAGSDGHPLRLFISTSTADGVPEGVTLLFTLSEDGLFHEYVLSDFKGKTIINKITLQNREINPLTLYVERLEFR